jgi:hypothetical protein
VLGCLRETKALGNRDKVSQLTQFHQATTLWGLLYSESVTEAIK